MEMFPFCSSIMESEKVTITYKGCLISIRNVSYCPNRDCKQGMADE